MVRANDELYFPDDYDWSVHFDFSALTRQSARMQPDGDGVQCGVWCIWYAHNRCIHGHGRVQEFYFQPANQRDVTFQVALRLIYFRDPPPAGQRPLKSNYFYRHMYAKRRRDDNDDRERATGHGPTVGTTMVDAIVVD